MGRERALTQAAHRWWRIEQDAPAEQQRLPQREDAGAQLPRETEQLAASQQVRAERLLRRLLAVQDPPARLLLDDGYESVNAARLLPGQLIEVRSGEVIPADCRIVEATDLEARRRENDLSAEKKTAHENIRHKGRMSYLNQLNQPKPKFVSHKAPNKAKGHKDKKNSNRLGDQLHYA